MENILEKIDPKILGARLQEARRARGFTQQDVAEEMDMARTTVVAIEKGERRITPDELIKLASRYGQSVSKLLNRTETISQEFVPQFRYSWRKDFEQTPDLERVSFDLQQLSEDYAELEKLNGITRTEIPSPQYSIKGAAIEQRAEEVALTERNRLGIGDGPISNLRQRLEMDMGLRIFYFKMPSSVSGIFVYNDFLGGCIGINSNHPLDRRNWSLAHECGHYLSSRYQVEITFLNEKRRQSANERFADAFAESFLMPASGLNRRFTEMHRSSPNGITMAEICYLADIYQVSVQALVIRLENLKRFPSGTWDSLVAEGFKPRKAQEIFGIVINSNLEIDDLPKRYINLAVSAYEKEEISEGQLAKYLRTDRVTARLWVDRVSAGYKVGGNDFLPVDVELSHELVGR